MTVSQSDRLLRRTVRRLQIASFTKQWYRWVIIIGVLYAALLLASRLLGVIPNWFEPRSLMAVPVLAALASLLFQKRPTSVDAARAVDGACGTKDLFLTVSLLEESPGEFKPLVRDGAEARAESIDPVAVVPYRFGNRSLNVAIAMGVLLCGAMFLPSFDPFGVVEAAQEDERSKEKLEESEKLTQLRVANIKRETSSSAESKEVKKAIDKLKADFNKMKPNNKKFNAQALKSNKNDLSSKYRKISSDKLREFLSRSSASQQFGGRSQREAQKWTSELKSGSTESLDREIKELVETLKKLEKTDDPVKKTAMQNKIRKKLQELADFANRNAGSKELAAALKRAMEQMEMVRKSSGKKELSEQASKALQESLELSKMELKQLAQSIKDLKELEESLKAVQMAEQANQAEALDGEKCEGCESMSDYAKLYAELVRNDTDGQGGGMKDRGIGEGGVAPEDDSLVSDFKNEKSKSPVTAGKILMTLKTKGVGETGDAKVRYREAIQRVRQGASDAILAEDIPPGYYDGIKTYFKNIAPPDATTDTEDSDGQ